MEEKPGFITPPPGLIPSAPRETSETVRLGERRAPIPAFVPVVPGAPPIPPAAAPASAMPPPAPEPRKQAKHADAPSDPQWNLTLHDGSVVHVSGSLLLGRDPARLDAWPDAGLLKINDPEKTVSKTHAAIDASGDGLVIVDLDSTNGVTVVEPSGDSTDFEPGQQGDVLPGSTIQLGQYRILVQRL